MKNSIPSVDRSSLAVLAVVLLLQCYFVRELLAFEMFFAIVFAVGLIVAAVAYLTVSLGASWFQQARISPEQDPAVLNEGGIES